MSMIVSATDLERSTLWEGLASLWKQGRCCDLTIRSNDGASFRVHSAVIAAASEPLAALLNGHFAEGGGDAVNIDAPGEVLDAILNYVYLGKMELAAVDATSVLRVADMWAMNDLKSNVAGSLANNLDLTSALRTLIDCELLGLDHLESQCERFIAVNFHAAANSEGFKRLSASQLGRLIKHEALLVESEEVVLKSVLSWQQAETGRDGVLGVLTQHIRFPLMALASLRSVQRHAQSIGPAGVDLERQARRAAKVHLENGCNADEPVAKRRCLPHWWSGLGSSIRGGVVVAKVSAPLVVNIYDEVCFVGCLNGQEVSVEKWVPGAAKGQVVIGRGAPVNGVHDISGYGFTFDPFGRILVADAPGDRIVRFEGGHGTVVGDGQWQLRCPFSVRATEHAIFALDGGTLENDGGTLENGDGGPLGTRIQKLQDGVATVVAGGNGPGSAANQFEASDFCVSGSGDLYICDTMSHRVQRWASGATEGSTLAGGNGRGSGLDQLDVPAGLAIDDEGGLYIADSENNRVLKYTVGSRTGVLVAGGNGEGSDLHQLSGPTDVALDRTGALYVSESENERVTRWGPPPAFLIH